MTSDFDQDPVVSALRDSLARHAHAAPSSGLLAEQIIAAADRADGAVVRRPRRTWRTWALPLVAAGAVAAAVTTVAGIAHYRPHAAQAPPAGSRPATTPSALSASASPQSTAASAAPKAGSVVGHGTSLHAVRVLDLTFAGTDDGWALASAACLRGSGRCTALLRTTDGRTWRDMSGAAFNVLDVRNCVDPCVQHLRFATDKIGYAYGPDALFRTDDGGRSWTHQAGGALALESFDQNVIRVTSTGAGCPGPCNIRVETAALGSSDWTAADIGTPTGTGVALSRSGRNAYLLTTRNRAGGGPATSTLYRSTDDGRHWSARGEPCPQSGAEVDSIDVASAPAGRVSLLCAVRFVDGRSFVLASTDGGVHFARRAGTVPAATARLLAGDQNTVLLTGGRGLARSTDGGATWTGVTAVQGDVSFIGFESSTVGRAVAADGSTIWTTRDRGLTWSAVAFGS